MSYNNGSTHDKSMTNSYTIEFPNGDSAKGSSRHQSHRKILGSSRAKPPPSKWDDAQKWLTGFSGGGGGGGGGGAQQKCKPRNSNADDRRLLPSHSQRARDSCSSIEGALDYDHAVAASQEEGETKKIDCNELFLKAQNANANPNPVEESAVGVRSIFLRDMGTEMTPIASKEPSRTGTPMRASTPISSRSSTPGRVRQGGAPVSERSGEAAAAAAAANYGRANGNGWVGRGGGEADCVVKLENSVLSVTEASSNSLESRAIAWDEAERAKYMARYKREEVKIQAWENHEKRKAEMEMKKIEVKAERMKSRAQEKLANKFASTRRIAEEKRTSAEAKLNERAARTSERADYIRRTGHLPSSFFSFKLPSLCG